MPVEVAPQVPTKRRKAKKKACKVDQDALLLDQAAAANQPTLESNDAWIQRSFVVERVAAGMAKQG
eukprot:9291666-Prorocentrum_lima.AAC.1